MSLNNRTSSFWNNLTVNTYIVNFDSLYLHGTNCSGGGRYRGRVIVHAWKQ